MNAIANPMHTGAQASRARQLGRSAQESEAKMTNEEKLDRRQRRSRNAIREAFRELLEERDLSQITVTEIARRADRDRKTFYLHYGCIEDLIDDLLEEECQKTIRTVEKKLEESGGSLDIAELYSELGMLFVSDINERSAILRHIDHRELIVRLRPILAKTIAEKDMLGISQALGPHLELFVSYFCSGLLALYSQWLDSDSELPIETLSELAMATVAGGVSALLDAAGQLQLPTR